MVLPPRSGKPINIYMASDQSFFDPLPVDSYLLQWHWSFELKELKSAEELLDLSDPIFPWWEITNTHVPYYLGNPILLGSTHFEFKGLIGNGYYNATGEYMQKVLFQKRCTPELVYSFTLLLYRKEFIELSETSTHSSFCRPLGGYLREFL